MEALQWSPSSLMQGSIYNVMFLGIWKIFKKEVSAEVNMYANNNDDDNIKMMI
jgi:hypothetical protein